MTTSGPHEHAERLQADVDWIEESLRKAGFTLNSKGEGKQRSGYGMESAVTRIRAALAELEQEKTIPRVTCVCRDSDGKEMDTVKLLGDREAVLAVVQVKAELEQARTDLTQLRSVWNAHMERCDLDADLQAEINALVPTFEQIQSWANAPSNTASAGSAASNKEEK